MADAATDNYHHLVALMYATKANWKTSSINNIRTITLTKLELQRQQLEDHFRIVSVVGRIRFVVSYLWRP